MITDGGGVRYRDAPGPLAVAHRGGAGLAAENTLEAFRRSHALGVRFLETDVRITRDGHLVAFHDGLLNRVTPLTGRIRDRTLAEVAATSVQGGGPVLALPELLATFPDSCFTIDVKDPAVIGPLAELINATGAAARVCVAGARGTWLRRLAELTGPELCAALSWRDLAQLASRGGRFPVGGFAHVPLRLGRLPVFRDGLLARAHDAGVRVVVWTVNDNATMHRLLDSGVDGIITDRPDVLREVLIGRGQWHTPGTHVVVPSG